MKWDDWGPIYPLREEFLLEKEQESAEGLRVTKEGYIMREFDTGATRDSEEGKSDYEGFLSPLVLRRYAEYMNKNRVQADGKVRDSDNWQKGIPLTAYMKSAWRHFMEWWTLHRRAADGAPTEETTDALCALLFNVMGYLHELEKGRHEPFVFYPTLGSGIPKMVDGDRTGHEKDTGGRH